MATLLIARAAAPSSPALRRGTGRRRTDSDNLNTLTLIKVGGGPTAAVRPDAKTSSSINGLSAGADDIRDAPAGLSGRRATVRRNGTSHAVL